VIDRFKHFLKFFMQSETDLKDLTTMKLVQLISQFL